MTFKDKILSLADSARASGKLPAFAYDRISDDVQSDGLSLSYQSSASQRYAEYMNLSIVHVFSVVESARKEGRKTFNEMLDLAIELGIKDVIFKNTDRMARNYADGIIRLEKLIDLENFNIHFYQNNRIISKQSNHNDRFILGIEIAVAKHLSDKISNDVREANKYKARNGIAPCRSPFGYIYDNVNKRHIINPHNVETLRMMFDLFDTGNYSLEDFTTYLNKNGVKTPTGKVWQKQSLWQVLRSPFYHGEFTYLGSIMPGTQDKYYEKDRFERRIKRLFSRTPARTEHIREFHLNNLLKCECGYSMYGDIAKGKYIYYIHKCPTLKKQLSISESDCFDMIDRSLGKYIFSESFGDHLKVIFKGILEEKKANKRDEISKLTRSINDIEAKKSRLIDLYADGEIDRDAVKTKMDQLSSNLEVLYNKRKAEENYGDKVFFAIANVIDNIRKFAANYQSANNAERVKLLKNIAETVTIDGYNVSINFKKPYHFILNEKLLSEMGKEFELVNVMLPRQDDTRTFYEDIVKHFALWIAA